jgi:hypothetical protein
MTANTRAANRPNKPLAAVALTLLLALPLGALTAGAYPAVQWSPYTRLNPSVAMNAEDGEVRVADDGTAWAVWVQATGGPSEIYGRRYTPSGGWSAEAAIDTSGFSPYACTMRSAGNRAGDVIVIWLVHNGTSYSLESSYFTAGWGWGSTQTVSFNRTVYGNCDQYAVAMNENGDATVAWQTTNGTVWHVRAARYAAGVGWGAEEIVAQMANQTGLDIQPAIDDAGASTVIWGENNGSDEWLYASRAAAGGAWSAAQRIFQHFDNGPAYFVYTDFLRVVAPLPGAVVASWRVYNNSWYAIWEVHYWAGAWSTAAIISDNGVWADYPSLASSLNGTVTLAMAQNSRIGTKWYTPGGAWTGTSNITGGIGYQDVAVAVNAVGQTVVVWGQWTGSAYHPFASTWAPWSSWTPAKQLDAGSTMSAQLWNSAGVDAAGDGIALWTVWTGALYQPYAARLYNADPDPLPLTIDYPRNRESVGTSSITVRGQTTPGAAVFVDGVPATVSASGEYAATISLAHGWTRIVVNATGADGPVAAKAAWVAYTDPAYAYGNETADRDTTGWTPVRTASGAAEVQTLYTNYGGSIMLTFSVSYGPTGDGMAYWVCSNGTTPYLFYAVPYVAGQGWQTPQLLSAQNGAAFNSQVFTDSSGRSTIVWEQDLGAGNTVWAARYSRSTGWSPLEDLTPAPDRGYGPRAAVGSGGTVFVTYARSNASGTQLAATRFIPGSGWQPAAVLGPADQFAEQTLAVAGASAAAVAWVNRTNGVSNVTVYRFNPTNGSWGPAVVALAGSTYIYNMQSVITSSGEMTIVYRQPTVNTTSYNLTALQSDASNNWMPPVDIDGALDGSTLNWHYSVGVDGSGNVWVIFLHVVSARQRPHAVEYVPGTGWGTPTVIDADTISKNWVMGGVSSDGSVIAAWSEFNGSQRAQAARYIPGLGWQAPEFLTQLGGHDWDLVVAMTTGGRALVVANHYPGYGNYYSTIGGWRFTPPDMTAPALAITSPANNSTTGAGWVEVRGVTEANARVWVNGFEAQVAGNGSFAVSVPLVNGTNLLRAFARDAQGNGANATVNVTFLDPVLQELEDLAAADVALQLDLDGVNASLAQAILDLGASTAQQLADLNASLLADLAAQNASLAADIGALNASLLADLAMLNSTLMDALLAQNASLWIALGALGDALDAANQDLSDALNQTAAELRAAIAALAASQNETDDNVTEAVARIAALEARLTALASDLNLTRDDFTALLDALEADLILTRDGFNAQLGEANSNATAERLRVNAALAGLGADINATRLHLQGSDQNLTNAVDALEAADSDLNGADAANQRANADTANVASGAQGLATIGALLAIVGVALALVAALLAMRARRPVIDDAVPAPSVPPAAAQAPAEEVPVVASAAAPHGGSSMSAVGEASSGEGPQQD